MGSFIVGRAVRLRGIPHPSQLQRDVMLWGGGGGIGMQGCNQKHMAVSERALSAEEDTETEELTYT